MVSAMQYNLPCKDVLAKNSAVHNMLPQLVCSHHEETYRYRVCIICMQGGGCFFFASFAH